MKRILALVIVLLSPMAIAGDEQTIIGTPSIDSVGIVTISECRTGKIYKVGAMASNPYFHFSNKITELSKSGDVLVELKGMVILNNGLEITHPIVISVSQGACDEYGT